MRSIVQMGYSLFFSVFVFFVLRSIIYASFGSGELVEGMNMCYLNSRFGFASASLHLLSHN